MESSNNSGDRLIIFLFVVFIFAVSSAITGVYFFTYEETDDSGRGSDSDSDSDSDSKSGIICGIDVMQNGKGTFKIKSNTGKWVYTVEDEDDNNKMKLSLTDDESKPNVSGWIISNEGTSSLGGDIRITSPNGYHFKDLKDEVMRIDSRGSNVGTRKWKFEGGEIDPNNYSILNKVKIKSGYDYYLNPSGNGFRLSKVDKSNWRIICEGPHPLLDTPLTYSDPDTDGHINPSWNLCTDDNKVIEYCSSNDKCGGAAEQDNGCWHLYEGKGAPWPTGKYYSQKLSFR